jgi:hypothetical protein
MITRTALGIMSAFLAVLAIGGCYSPGGGIMPRAGGAVTYYSTERSLKTVKFIDIRTNEEFFTIDIPADKQLSYQIDPGKGDDPVNTPDLLRYEVMPMGTSMGSLHNAMTIPNAASRRIDVYVSQGPTFAKGVPERQLRTDEVANRPDWWTPKGGPMPEDQSRTLYDR